MNAMPAAGRGFSADDLHARELAALKERLEATHPELRIRGVELSTAELRQKDALDAFKVELQRAVGAQGMSEALELFRREAEAIVKKSRAVERLGGNAANLPQSPA